MPRKKRPAKPYPDFPLTPHPSGQWCKKIKGRLYYFGKDADAALNKYREERDDLQAGRTPRHKAGEPTIRDLVNRYLTSKKLKLEANELSPRTFRDLYDLCERLIDELGKDRFVIDLAPEDFEKLRAEFAKKRGPVALGDTIQKIRSVFRYAFEDGLIDRPVRFGSSFKKPSRKKVREARHAGGAKMLEAAEVRKLIDAAKQPVKAMILVGINCGYGNSDLANLTKAAIDLKGGWIRFPRPKTAVMRRAPLWPETVEALREAIDNRPDAKDEADAGLAFITKYGKRWVRTNERADKGAVPIDGIGQEFIKLLKAAGLKRPGIGFYVLRHVFRTIADGCKDQVAVNFIMGHVDEHVSANYRERIEDDRLRAVTDCVHAWLFPDASAKADPAILPFRATAG